MKGHKHSKKKWVAGALLGSIALGVTALLFAPKTRKNMRTFLDKQCRSMSRKTKRGLCALSHHVDGVTKKAKRVVRRTIRK